MNKEIIENLFILEDYYTKMWYKNKSSKDNFRRLAYEKATKEINKLDFNIESIKQLKGIKGIGKSILEKIEEYLDTGFIKKVKEIKLYSENDKDKILKKFLDIWGIGFVKANKLYNMGYRSIEQVRDNAEKILNRQQLIGLKYYEDLKKNISRMTITVIHTIIRYILNREYGKETYIMNIAGSYRRGKEYSGDIDILISSEKFNLEDIIKILIKNKIITDILSMQKEKFMGIGQCPRKNEQYFRIDIEFLPKEEYGSGLLYFTGSGEFNKEMRMYAKNLGYTLSQHGLKNNKTGFVFKSEKEEEIFDKLNLKYIEPNKRN